MSPTIAKEFLPVELVFNPNWWHQTVGISFDAPFYFDAETRIQNDVAMRRILHQRYGDLGLGEADPQPRPIIGSRHVAGGFVIPALLGAGPLEKVGICCINMDYDTPDDNIFAMFDVIQRYRRYGGRRCI